MEKIKLKKYSNKNIPAVKKIALGPSIRALSKKYLRTKGMETVITVENTSNMYAPTKNNLFFIKCPIIQKENRE